jgi:hypothetical protein
LKQPCRADSLNCLAAPIDLPEPLLISSAPGNVKPNSLLLLTPCQYTCQTPFANCVLHPQKMLFSTVITVIVYH